MTDRIQAAKDWLKSMQTLGIKTGDFNVIATLERGLAALEDAPAKINYNPQERFSPSLDEKYFAIDSNGEVFSAVYYANDPDRFRKEVGNCYRTEEAAMKVLEMKKRIKKLQKTVRFDWKDPKQKLWYVGYNKQLNEWDCGWSNIASIGEIAFPTEEAGKALIEEFGDDLFLLVGRI